MEKLKDEQIIKLFESKGYKIIGEIKNTSTKILCEKDGYRYHISYSNLRMGKTPSLWGIFNMDNLEHNIKVNMKKRGIKARFVSAKAIQKSKRKRILVTFKCECGKYFDKILEDAIYETYIACSDCTKKKRGLSRRKSEKHIQTILNAGFKIIQDDIKNIRDTDLVEVEDSEGYRGFICSNSTAANKGMSKFDIRINKKYYVYNVNVFAKNNGINTECLSLVEKRHVRQSLLFRCSCGNKFVTSIASFQNGKSRCDVCAKSISRYEFAFKSYLEKNNIEYIYQYSINQCRDILPLPFDFYLPKYDCLIEIDGEGHFYPCHFNQISKADAEKSYHSIVRHDRIKNDYCKENNKRLLRISYDKFKDESYKDFFQNFIREVANSN